MGAHILNKSFATTPPFLFLVLLPGEIGSKTTVQPLCTRKVPDFLISSRHPRGVQGTMQSSNSPLDSFPAFTSCNLKKKQNSKIHFQNTELYSIQLVLNLP